MMNHSSLLPLLLSLVFALDQVPFVSALNFGALDTPLLDSVSGFLCGEREGPVCSMLGLLTDAESEEAATSETGEERATLGQFLIGLSCDTGLVPDAICGALSGDGTEDQQVAPVALGVAGESDTRIIVDGVVLGMMCGENGFAPDAFCNAIVGEDRNSGLIRRVCATGLLATPRLCGVVGVESPPQEPEDGDNGGRKMLRH